jgi:uncharacterized membrane protein
LRLLFIDWLRGVAVLGMILWHTIDSWTIRTGRDTAAFNVIIFIAGWVAPLFLFLAGVAVPLAATAGMRRGLCRADAGWAVQKRGWAVFLLAHLFRFQSFVLNPNGSWNTILKPDILNILGLGVVAAAYAWGRAETHRSRLAWLLVPTAVIVLILTPLSRTWWWPTLLHPRLEAYIRPVGAYGVFSLFPTVAYLLAGAFVGGLLAEKDPRDAAFHRRMGWISAGLVATGLAARALPTPSSITAAEWAPEFVWRTGAIVLALTASWALFRRRAPSARNALVVFGQTSLFVYWVHVELAYGVFTLPIRHTLTLPWSFAAFVVFTVFMLGCAVLWRGRARSERLIPAHMRAASKISFRASPVVVSKASWISKT